MELLTQQPRKRVRDAAATQRRLLEAAEAEFAAHGYQGARLRNIAKLAGVQPALIHHYFGDKEGLYRAMLDRALTESSTLSFDILGTQATFRDVVSGFAGMLLRFNRKYDNILTILRKEGSAGSIASELTRGVVKQRVLPIVEAVIAYVSVHQRSGELRSDITAEEIVYSMMALTSYPFVEQGFLETCLPTGLITSDADLERRKTHIVDTILRHAAP